MEPYLGTPEPMLVPERPLGPDFSPDKLPRATLPEPDPNVPHVWVAKGLGFGRTIVGWKCSVCGKILEQKVPHRRWWFGRRHDFKD